MEYKGKYSIFDVRKISTYPLSTRSNKVTLDDLIRPRDVDKLPIDLPDEIREKVEAIAEAIISTRQAGSPVVFFTGAHLIKNGLGPLLVELVNRGIVTLVAGNAATAIHDFELALIGQTSENVPNALGKGRFGMAYEFAYINAGLSLGDVKEIGFGESLGRMICDETFRETALGLLEEVDGAIVFEHAEISVLAACYRNDIPFTAHAGIGTDVIDQHPSFDGRAKGGCSGRDFLIYTDEIARLADGGVVLNVGSAVTGPEVLLKAVSMAANCGSAASSITTADFDIREFFPEAMTDESAGGYYFRDQKSIVTRIPQAFAGKSFYVRGDQKETFPLLFKMLVERD
jgi:hypothetical protein